MKIDLYQKAFELAKLRVVRNIKWTKHSKICQFLELNFSFPNWKNSKIFLMFQIVKFWKFVDFQICKIPKISEKL